jgi:hypothetical protein
MTLPEQIGKIADAMKGNPSCLAAITLAALFALLTYSALQHDANRNESRNAALVTLLNHCINETGNGDGKDTRR